mmetsp:Transcript_34420/g.90524  ORF Transcript_34420/g.90524 Transcript_34420/m.90524 type:complete len:319 (+) Transcript_34420:480-1436(+)
MVGILCDGGVDQLEQVGRQPRLHLWVFCGQRSLDDILDEVKVVVRDGVRVASTAHLESNQSHAPHVRCERVRLASYSLRAHVGKSAAVRLRLRVCVVERLRDAEVRQLDEPLGIEEDVGRLQVAVHGVPLLVKVRQPLQHLEQHVRRHRLQEALCGRARGGRQDSFERTAVHKLEREVDCAFVVEGVVEGDEVVALGVKDRLDLVQHLVPRLARRLDLLLQHLDRERLACVDVFREVDTARVTAPQHAAELHVLQPQVAHLAARERALRDAVPAKGELVLAERARVGHVERALPLHRRQVEGAHAGLLDRHRAEHGGE